MNSNDGGGGKAEEAVRAFFLRSGYFAVRGVKFRFDFDGDDVTDLDIWAYGVGSLTNRERVVVDCKYKIRHAQAFERVLWVEGLRRATFTERAVVATTDGRESVRAFASRMQIRLIGPEMLEQLISSNKASERLTEEDFSAAVLPLDDKLFGRIRERFDFAKSLLLRPDFDSINSYFADMRYYAEESTRSRTPEALARLFCLSASFLLVNLDFILRDAAFTEIGRIRSRIDDGVRFGARGRAGANTILNAIGTKKKAEIMRAAETVRADLPAEFFAQHAGSEWFHQTALALEGAAYRKAFLPVKQLPPAAQSVIGLVLDFLGIDRHVIFGIGS